MITYILKSASCLALLLFFYHFILEREKMHNFNRFYLLGSVLFSFLVPFATITIPSVPEIIETVQYYSQPIFIENTTPIVIEETFNYTQLFIGAYILVSFIFLLRFGRNLFKIIQKISSNKKVLLKKATLVLVEDKILPHTFWNYIILNKKEYEQGNIEEELFTHELTHVTQRHTIDVLLIELLQIVFWINPLFIFLKKAIQLNHEFLADEKVINQHKNTFQYQRLLLNKAAWNNEYYLASNLNYSLTKKRLNMMTTQSSQKKILLKKLAVIPLLAGFIFLFAERVEAQEKQEIIETIVENVPFQKVDLTETEIYKEYAHRNTFSFYTDKDGKHIKKKYSELTKEEKKKVFTPPLKSTKIVPTKKQFDDLKDGSKVAVWIDGKVVKNEVLNKYKNTDFARYSNSHVYKNARTERFPQENQARLETIEYYENQNKKRAKAFEDYKKKHEVIEVIEEQVDKNTITILINKDGGLLVNGKASLIKDLENNLENIEIDKDKAHIFITTDKDSKEEDLLNVKNILRKNGFYKISINNKLLPPPPPTKQEKEVSNQEMAEYKALFTSGEKTKIYKQKDVEKMVSLYLKMSKEQQNSVSDIRKVVPPPPPAMDTIYTYNRMADRVKRTSENRKANIVFLEEMYTKMTPSQKKEVTEPSKILPPPPPTKQENTGNVASIFTRKLNDSTIVSFSSNNSITKRENAVSKMDEMEKKSFNYRRMILYTAEMKGKKINYKIGDKKASINEANNYINDNPKSLIKSSDNSDGSLTLSFFDSKSEKMKYNQLQTIYTKIFKIAD